MKIKEILKKYYLRVIILFTGMFIMAIGGTCLIQAGMGSDALTVFNQGTGVITSTSFGTGILINCAVIFIALVIINRKAIGFGTFAITFILGFISDLIINTNIIKPLSKDYLNIILAIVGCFLSSTGVAIYLYSNLGCPPDEGILITIRDRKHWNLGIIKIINDAICFVIGYLFGGTIGVASFIAVIIMGPILNKVLKLLGKLNIEGCRNENSSSIRE